jgi:hypothetical protein
MTLTNFPNGISSFGVPVIGSGGAGDAGAIPVGPVYWWVDSVNGSDGYDGSYDLPYATLAKAQTRTTAVYGDVIVLKPGHAETLSSAGACTLSTSGVRVVGLGTGDNRPTITFDTATTASLLISGNSVSVKNIICIAGINSLANPIDVTGDGVSLDVTWKDGTYEAVGVIRGVNTDRFNIKLRDEGLTGGSLRLTSIALKNATETEIYIDQYGKVATAVINFYTTACKGVRITGNTYVSGTTDGSLDVVDSATGSTWWANIFDGSAGSYFTGGSGSTYAKLNVTAITDALYGTNGIATWLSPAAYANNVSIAEVLGYIQDAVRNGSGAALATNKSLVDALGTNGTTVTDSAVSVLGAVGANSANNAFDSTSVVSNADGSVLEREEYMQTQNVSILGFVGNTPATYVPGLGYLVSKTENVNTATGVDLFTVTGKVLISVWTGEVTNAIGAATTDYKLRVKGDNVDLCATSDIHAAGVGFIFQMCSDAGDSLINTASAAKTADTNGKGIAHRIVGLAGGTGLVLQSNRTAGDAGDAIIHSIWYLPLEAGASVAAA